MENGTELLPQPGHWKGFNFLFHNDFLIWYLKEYEVRQEPPNLYLHRKTKEPFYFLNNRHFVEHDERLLPWPSEFKFSNDGFVRIYPVALSSEAEEENIFRDYVFSLYRNWGQNPWGSQFESYEGTDAVNKFLEYQYSNSPMGVSDFYEKVESIIESFGNSSNKRQRECNVIVRKWLEKTRQELKEELELKADVSIEIIQPAVEAIPPATAEETKDDEKNPDIRLKMLIIHYLQELGVMNTAFNDKTKVAPILSLLLGKNSQNIRERLGFNQPQYLESDLETLIPLFECLGQQAEAVVKNMKKNLSNAENDPNNKSRRTKLLEP